MTVSKRPISRPSSVVTSLFLNAYPPHKRHNILIIKSLKEQSNLTEEMKNTDQLYWVGMMNNFKNQAEEVVFKELIYV